MSIETNKATIRRLFEELFNNRNLAVVEELISPDYVNHNGLLEVHGHEGVKRAMAMQFAAFPDLHTTIEELIAEGDKVVVRGIDRLTLQPAGKKVSLPWIEILRLENGKAVEAWYEADPGPIKEQLDAALQQG